MLFWLFVIIMVVGIVLYIVGYRYWNSHKHPFLYKHGDTMCGAGAMISVLSGIVVIIMAIILCCSYINVDAKVAANKERYTALEYKVTSGACRDEFGLLSKEVVDEVQDWNEDIRYNQSTQYDFWIGIFYPNVFDQFETIDYEKYNTGNHK